MRRLLVPAAALLAAVLGAPAAHAASDECGAALANFVGTFKGMDDTGAIEVELTISASGEAQAAVTIADLSFTGTGNASLPAEEEILLVELTFPSDDEDASEELIGVVWTCDSPPVVDDILVVSSGDDWLELART